MNNVLNFALRITKGAYSHLTLNPQRTSTTTLLHYPFVP